GADDTSSVHNMCPPGPGRHHRILAHHCCGSTATTAHSVPRRCEAGRRVLSGRWRLSSRPALDGDALVPELASEPVWPLELCLTGVENLRWILLCVEAESRVSIYAQHGTVHVNCSVRGQPVRRGGAAD